MAQASGHRAGGGGNPKLASVKVMRDFGHTGDVDALTECFADLLSLTGQRRRRSVLMASHAKDHWRDAGVCEAFPPLLRVIRRGNFPGLLILAVQAMCALVENSLDIRRRFVQDGICQEIVAEMMGALASTLSSPSAPHVAKKWAEGSEGDTVDSPIAPPHGSDPSVERGTSLDLEENLDKTWIVEAARALSLLLGGDLPHPLIDDRIAESEAETEASTVVRAIGDMGICEQLPHLLQARGVLDRDRDAAEFISSLMVVLATCSVNARRLIESDAVTVLARSLHVHRSDQHAADEALHALCWLCSARLEGDDGEVATTTAASEAASAADPPLPPSSHVTEEALIKSVSTGSGGRRSDGNGSVSAAARDAGREPAAGASGAEEASNAPFWTAACNSFLEHSGAERLQEVLRHHTHSEDIWVSVNTLLHALAWQLGPAEAGRKLCAKRMADLLPHTFAHHAESRLACRAFGLALRTLCSPQDAHHARHLASPECCSLLISTLSEFGDDDGELAAIICQAIYAMCAADVDHILPRFVDHGLCDQVPRAIHAREQIGDNTLSLFRDSVLRAPAISVHEVSLAALNVCQLVVTRAIGTVALQGLVEAKIFPSLAQLMTQEALSLSVFQADEGVHGGGKSADADLGHRGNAGKNDDADDGDDSAEGKGRGSRNTASAAARESHDDDSSASDPAGDDINAEKGERVIEKCCHVVRTIVSSLGDGASEHVRSCDMAAALSAALRHERAGLHEQLAQPDELSAAILRVPTAPASAHASYHGMGKTDYLANSALLAIYRCTQEISRLGGRHAEDLGRAGVAQEILLILTELQAFGREGSAGEGLVPRSLVVEGVSTLNEIVQGHSSNKRLVKSAETKHLLRALQRDGFSVDRLYKSLFWL